MDLALTSPAELAKGFVPGETGAVIGWHRQGFPLFWTWLSRRKGSGRPGLNGKLRDLVRKMAANPLWVRHGFMENY
jgi:hypothetical protein